MICCWHKIQSSETSFFGELLPAKNQYPSILSCLVKWRVDHWLLDYILWVSASCWNTNATQMEFWDMVFYVSNQMNCSVPLPSTLILLNTIPYLWILITKSWDKSVLGPMGLLELTLKNISIKSGYNVTFVYKYLSLNLSLVCIPMQYRMGRR